jgi:hypothetical protein
MRINLTMSFPVIISMDLRIEDYAPQCYVATLFVKHLRNSKQDVIKTYFLKLEWCVWL